MGNICRQFVYLIWNGTDSNPRLSVTFFKPMTKYKCKNSTKNKINIEIITKHKQRAHSVQVNNNKI